MRHLHETQGMKYAVALLHTLQSMPEPIENRKWIEAIANVVDLCGLS